MTTRQKAAATSPTLEMSAEMQAETHDVIGLASAFARADSKVFVQHTVTAAERYAIADDTGYTICGVEVSRHTQAWSKTRRSYSTGTYWTTRAHVMRTQPPN